MSSSLRPSRLAGYSIAATAAAAGSGGAAVADVTSGTLDLSYGRSAGSLFFNNFAVATSTYGSNSAAIGDLNLFFFGYGQNAGATATFDVVVSTSNSEARFNNSTVQAGGYGLRTGGLVDAGEVWSTGSSTDRQARGFLFFGYYNPSASAFSTWTNPNATGTKFLNFKFAGQDIHGWIQLDFDITDANDWSVSISNWAYSDDGPLAAGSTEGTPAVPGVGGLAALAIGAAGVRGRRQRAAG